MIDEPIFIYPLLGIKIYADLTKYLIFRFGVDSC